MTPDEEFPTLPKDKVRDLAKAIPRAPRRRSRFETWATSPIWMFRVSLTAAYVISLYMAVSAFVAGSPTFDITAPQGWTPYWAIIAGLGAIVAGIGSTTDTRLFRKIERWGSYFITGALFVYTASIMSLAYGFEADMNKVTPAAAYLFMFVILGLRLAWLISQAGRKPADEPSAPAATIESEQETISGV